MSNSAEIETRKHIARVNILLCEFAKEMIERGIRHDASKLDPVELGPLQKMQELIEQEGQVEFGSEAYKQRTAMLSGMLENHYKCNSHHPEHYEAKYGGDFKDGHGVYGMDLFDLVEMFFDWKAASERSGSKSMKLLEACERFNVSPQLAAILANTANRLGYEI